MASKEQLEDWNLRVRRLANAYAPKYRPVFLPLAYHVNLDEGLNRTYIKVDTIVSGSARYTAGGKPLQARYVKKLLAEMTNAGAVKAEERYREDTGRQTSSYRYLNTAVAVDRRGFAVHHDFQAPFAQVGEEKDTPRDTPGDTPGDTPQDTRTAFELDRELNSDCPSSKPGSARDDGRREVSQNQNPRGQAPRTPQDPGRASSVPVSSASAAAPGDSSADGEAVDGLIDWSGNGPDDDGKTSRDYLASCLEVPVDSIHPSLWRWLGTLGLDADSSDATALMNAADASVGKRTPAGHFKAILPTFVREARAKREAEAETRAATERAERELWESTEAERNKILATMPDYVPGRVRPRAGAWFRDWYTQGSVLVWHHPEFDVVFAGNDSKRPGPDWKAGYLRRDDWDRTEDQDVIPLRQES